jgi:hypothetical protein
VKELHFVRTTSKMDVATEGPYRFALWQVTGKPGWSAAIFEREGRRKEPKLQATFPSRAAAIDWLARYRKPEVAA